MMDAVSALLQVQASTTTNSTAGTGAPLLFGNALLYTIAEIAVAVASIAIFGTLLTRIVVRVSDKAGASKAVASSVRQWIAVLMIVSAAAAVAGLTGLSSEFTTLTISGIGGLAVTLALQSTLSNIIAGVLMLQDGILRLGDEIEFGSVRGEVVRLTLRSTWIKTGEGAISVIGNSNLAAGPIVNRTAKARLEKKLQV